MSDLLDDIIEATERRAREADDAPRPAAAPPPAEQAERKPPAWLGRSAAEMLAGRGGRASMGLDVETEGARARKEVGEQ